MPDELLVLGSSCGLPTWRRFPSAYALTVTGKLFLLDCGAPVSTLLYGYDLDPIEVQAVFLTHWHMDHVANLGLLLSQNHQRKRAGVLKVYGPRGTRGKIRRLLTDSFLLPEELSYELEVTNVKPNKTYKDALIRVTFFKTRHLERPKYKTHFGRKAIAYGMMIKGPGWRVVYGGDLRSPNELAPYVKGCDLLIHEMAHHHPEAVAEFAAAAKIPHVLISHIGPEFDESPEKIVEAFSGRYDGDLIVAEDGTRVQLSNIRKSSKIEIKSAYVPSTGIQRGQMRVVVARLDAPFGVALADTDKIEVKLTVDAGTEDTEAKVQDGVTGLRRKRIVRLLTEAREQGGVLTQDELARVLHVNARTIGRDLQVLKGEGHQVYTRGQMKETTPD
jgi:ribonuclease BN (tRNA processing enzyme)